MQPKYKRSNFVILSMVFVVMLFLSACQLEVEVKRDPSFEGVRNVYRGGIYSTYVNGKERVGTSIKTYYDEEVVRKGDVSVITRRFVDDNSSGYHKKSLPWELVHRTPIQYEIRNDTLISVSGFEKFKTQVVPSLQIPKKREKELDLPNLEAQAGRFLRHEWFLTHQLVGKFKTKENVTDRVRFKNLGNWTVDSVVTVRVEDIDDRDCFRYEVYFKEPLKQNHLMFEQMAAGYYPDYEQFKPFKFKEAHGEGVQTVWTDLKTGRLCKTHLNQTQYNTAVHKETGEALEFKSIRFSEALYTYPKAKQ